MLTSAVTDVCIKDGLYSALLDSGCTDSFFNNRLVDQLSIAIIPSGGIVRLASSGQTATIMGHCIIDIPLHGNI